MYTAISMIFTQAIEVRMKLQGFTEHWSVVINILNLVDLEMSHDHMLNICVFVGKLKKMIEILFLCVCMPAHPCQYSE